MDSAFEECSKSWRHMEILHLRNAANQGSHVASADEKCSKSGFTSGVLHLGNVANQNSNAPLSFVKCCTSALCHLENAAHQCSNAYSSFGKCSTSAPKWLQLSLSSPRISRLSPLWHTGPSRVYKPAFHDSASAQAARQDRLRKCRGMNKSVVRRTAAAGPRGAETSQVFALAPSGRVENLGCLRGAGGKRAAIFLRFPENLASPKDSIARTQNA